MLALAPVLVLLPSVLGGLVPQGLHVREESPNLTCGSEGAGEGNDYTCPETDACCSQYGYCGTGDGFCVTTAGCQADFSFSADSCTEPVSGETISVDGTCGTTEAGSFGYMCPPDETSCCSVAGYCGDSADHCGTGCQSEFGRCDDAAEGGEPDDGGADDGGADDGGADDGAAGGGGFGR